MKLVSFMAHESFTTYNALTRHPSFIRFFEMATPIDVIESSKIGSRPSRRTNQRTLTRLTCHSLGFQLDSKPG